MEKYDVIIIGAGVTGTAVARELSRYQIKTCVLEREEDVCCGTSKANSAIIHAGYDAEPGTLKAKLNVRGNLLIGELAEKLDFPFKRNGSLVLCLDEKDYPNLQKLYEKGITKQVADFADKSISHSDDIRLVHPGERGRCILCAIPACFPLLPEEKRIHPPCSHSDFGQVTK